MTGLREKKKSERKDRIFSAAVELFNEKGFSKTSMQDIADKADLAVGTLYNYFPSKNDLLLDIMQEKMELTITGDDALFNVNLQNHNAKDIIKSLLKKIFSIPLLVNKESMKEIFIATLSSDVHMQKGMILDIELMKAFQGLLERLQKNNMINPEMNSHNATKIFYSIILVQMMMYLFNPEFDNEKPFENTDEIIDLIFQGVKP